MTGEATFVSVTTSQSHHSRDRPRRFRQGWTRYADAEAIEALEGDRR
jgi:hypothetical protein